MLNKKWKLLILGSLLSTSQACLSKPIPHPIIDSLSGLRIERVSLENQILTVIYKDEDVSDLMALTAAESVCSSRFRGEPKWPQETLKSVRVLNHWQMQGFEFSLDARICDSYGSSVGINANEFFKQRMKKYP
ncbi:hypothetical protein ACP26C_16525 [Franconibacter helveticus 513]|uniref:hypothetical protein n=1 Tax=Franconibacter helveticus TaxID=357240 RepID=UPI00111305D0|nr:hypothetical protein [Franconibacter helveticus]